MDTETTISDVLHFDPFSGGSEFPNAPAEDATTPAEETPKTESTVSDEISTKTAPTQPQATETPPAPMEKKVDETVSSEQIEHWRNIAEHYKQAAEASKPAKAENAESPKQDERNYAFEVPDQLIEALTSSDVGTFKQGVTALITGMARAVDQQLFAHIEKLYNPRFEQLPSHVMNQIAQQQAMLSVRNDFYGTYKELDNPALYNIVQQTAERIAKETKKTAWDSEIRDATAKEVKAMLAAASGAQAPNPPVLNPPKMLGGGGARVPTSGGDTLSKEISELMDLF